MKSGGPMLAFKEYTEATKRQIQKKKGRDIDLCTNNIGEMGEPEKGKSIIT